MRRSNRNASIGFIKVFVICMYAVPSLGCGAVGADGLFGLETCDILNCDGLFFGNLADEHNEVNDAEAHDEEGEVLVDGVDGHDDEGVDNATEAGHDDTAGSNDINGPA